MKHEIITSMVLLIISTNLFAQDTLSDNFLTNNYKEYSDNALEKLDKSQIPYGILYEKVQPLSNLDFFQIENRDALTNDIHFFQAYHEYFLSHFDTKNLITEEEIYNQLDVNEKTNRYYHPLGFLFANFATIKSNALQDGLLRFENGQFLDVLNQNPYNTVKSIVVSPLSTEDWTIGKHYVQLENNYIFGNGQKSIRKVRMYFDQVTGWQERDVTDIPMSNWNKNTIAPFEYDLTSIDKQIDGQIEVEFTDGTLLHSNFSQKVKNKFTECADCIPIGGIDGGDQLNIVGDLYPSLSDYGITPTNAEGTAYIFYANQQNFNAHKLVKPVIFLDGYDPDNGRDVRRIYSKYVDKKIPVLAPDGLAKKIRDDGYDLVILDFKDGGDFLEQNAMVVEKLLTTLYQSHQNTMQKDFVVIGPSMGSIVAQFALAHMEANSIPHHTRDYISFDGPHQGANVARGVTDLVEYLTWGGTMNLIATKKLSNLRKTLYNNHAARQMLVHHPSSSNEWPTSDNERNIFLSHLNSVGKYAQNLRKVAVINGNRNGIVNQYLSSCNEFTHIQLYRYQFPPFLLPGSFVNCDWSVRAITNSGRCKDGHFFTLWPLANIAGIPFGTKKFYSDVDGGKSGYDYCPGSYFSAITDKDGDDAEAQILKLIDHFKGVINITYSNFSGVGNIGKETFIPTISAGDINQTSLDLNQNLQNVVLAKCAGTTPFDRVYANSYSTDHVAVDANIAHWFLNEIEETLSPLETVETPVIVSNTTVCDGQSITLSTPNILSSFNANKIWSTQTNNFTYLNQSNSTLATKIIGSANGVSTFNLNATSNCGNYFGQIDVNSGVPIVEPPLVTVTNIMPNKNQVTFDFQQPLTGLTNNWSVTYGSTTFGTNMGTVNRMVVGQNKIIKVICNYSNSCGTNSENYDFEIYDGGASYKNNSQQFPENTLPIIIYPNPSSDFWTISLMDEKIKSMVCQLYDITGKIVYENIFDNIFLDNIKINILRLSKGTYFLKINTYENKYFFKLLKE